MLNVSVCRGDEQLMGHIVNRNNVEEGLWVALKIFEHAHSHSKGHAA